MMMYERFSFFNLAAVFHVILFLCTKEALQFLSLDGNRVISVKCSENVSERHRRAFDRRVTVRQVLTTLGIFLVASLPRPVVMSSCRHVLSRLAIFCLVFCHPRVNSCLRSRSLFLFEALQISDETKQLS